jgi:hypothetical protein
MIAHAKNRFPNSIYKNIQFHVVDASRLSFEERFNIVISNDKPILRGKIKLFAQKPYFKKNFVLEEIV